MRRPVDSAKWFNKHKDCRLVLKKKIGALNNYECRDHGKGLLTSIEPPVTLTNLSKEE